MGVDGCVRLSFDWDGFLGRHWVLAGSGGCVELGLRQAVVVWLSRETRWRVGRGCLMRRGCL